MELLPRGSGYFDHVSSLEKFDVDWGNFYTLTLLAKTTSNYLATLAYTCVCDQQFLRATKFQNNFCTPGLGLFGRS